MARPSYEFLGVERSKIKPPRSLHCRGLGRNLLGGFDAMDDTATCARCEETKAIIDFPRDRTRKSGRYPYCKTCNSAKVKAQWEVLRTTPEGRAVIRRTSWRTRLRTYGVSEEQYFALLASQNGVCAICSRPETHRNRDCVKPLTVDHNHVTGQVRALLCHHCNCVLGLAREDPSTLDAAAAYLRRWD